MIYKHIDNLMPKGDTSIKKRKKIQNIRKETGIIWVVLPIALLATS